jgi:DNA polymerase-3 subunit alpha
MEGLAKSAGTHAAGVVIGDRPLIEYVPLQKLSGKEEILTQWTDVEKAGLLKMDFLGLRNLTILDKAVNNVEAHRHIRLVPKDLPLDDQETFALLQRGETKGIFQLESCGMRDLLTKMKPDQFADIIATSALYRPGPLEGGMVMDYVERKHRRQPVPRVHPIIDEVLAETYGVMVYQEQVMRILNRLGGIELAKAYQCIKAISKKKLDIIAKYREQFIDGAQKNNMSLAQAEELFGLIEKFAGYGFNKSHSTAYGAIAYQTAFFKAHYPAEFMAALLSCGMESTERIAEHTDDCRRMSLEVLPPDVNRSDVEFTVVEHGAPTGRLAAPRRGARPESAPPGENGDTGSTKRSICFGLGAIRGVGLAAMQALVEERRQNGPYRSIFDVAERLDPKQLTKGTLEILNKAGALDVLGGTRAQHELVIDRAVQGAAARQRDKARGQKSLFGEEAPATADAAAQDVLLPETPDWPQNQRLNYEKEVIGFYLSSHPLTQHAGELSGYATHKVAELRDLGDGADVLIGGMIGSIKKAATKKPSRNGHSRYVNFDLEDDKGVVRCIMWPDDFAREGELVQPEAIVLVKGRIDARGREPNIICNKLYTLEAAAKEFTKQVMLKFRRGYHTEDDLQRVRSILSEFPGKTPVALAVDTWLDENAGATEAVDGGGANRVRAWLSVPIQVSARPELKSALEAVLGSDGFRFQSAPNGKSGRSGTA